MWSELREELDRFKIPKEHVALPGEDLQGWEGALKVTQSADGKWELVMSDYGQTRSLFKRDSEREMFDAVRLYVLTPLPRAEGLELTDAEFEEMMHTRGQQMHELAEQIQASGPNLIQLPQGLLIDRIGVVDGFLSYHFRTSFEARAMHPFALEQRIHVFRVANPFLVTAELTQPWFGQPGGGVRFVLEEPMLSFRDLIHTGVLDYLAPADHPDAPEAPKDLPTDPAVLPWNDLGRYTTFTLNSQTPEEI